MIHSAVRITLLSLLRSDLVAGLNQTVIDVQKTDSMMADYNCFSSSCGRLNFLSWRRKYSLCWAFLFYNGVYVIVPLQVLGDGGAQEPEWLHCSHSAVHDGEWGRAEGREQGALLYREKSSEERAQPWGAPVLIVRVLGVYFPSFTICCLSARKLLIHWQTEVGTFYQLQFWRLCHIMYNATCIHISVNSAVELLSWNTALILNHKSTLFACAFKCFIHVCFLWAPLKYICFFLFFFPWKALSL